MKKPKTKRAYMVYEKPICSMLTLHTNKNNVDLKACRFAEVEVRFVRWLKRGGNIPRP